MALCGAILCLLGSPYAPVAWSPDSNRIAFLAVAGDAGHIFEDAWLLGLGSPGTRQLDSGGVTCELWLAELGDGRLSRIDRAELLGSPVWSPDGNAFAYARFDRTRGGSGSGDAADNVPGVLSLVRVSRQGTSGVLHRENGIFRSGSLVELPLRSMAWSPNGLYLAAEWEGPRRLLILSVTDRKLVAHLPEAGLPSWSPDGRHLAFHSGMGQQGLCLVRVPGVADSAPQAWTEQQFVAEVPNPFLPAVWDRRGSSFLLPILQTTTDKHSKPALDIAQVSITDLQPRKFYSVPLDASGSDGYRGCSFAHDEPRGVLFVAVSEQGAPMTVDWVDGEAERDRIWHPLDDETADHTIPLGSLAVSPDGSRLAFRYGLPEWSAAVGVYDLGHQEMSTWAPNDATALRALWAIVESTQRLVRKLPKEVPSPFDQDWEQPAPGPRPLQPLAWPLDLFDQPQTQMARSAEMQAAIDKLTDQGLWLLRQRGPVAGLAQDVAGQDPASSVRAATARPWSEVELFFLYARADYAEALTALDRLAGTLGELSPDHQMALETIRVQCYLGSGRIRQARSALPRLIAQRVRQRAALKGADRSIELQLLGLPAESLAPDRQAAGGIDAAQGEERDRLLERLRDLSDACHQMQTAS